MYWCAALSALLAATAQAGQETGACKASPQKTKVVRQVDGSEMIRLAQAPAKAPASMARIASPQNPRLDAWLEAAAEPRLMTALATLPHPDGQNLPEGVDPSLVRSWAEFIDPSLAMQWQAMGPTAGFTEALLRWPEKGAWPEKAGGVASRAYGIDMGLRTTWSNVVSEGARHSLTGQQALQEWLKLPTPEPRSNPWLSNLGSYRY